MSEFTVMMYFCLSKSFEEGGTVDMFLLQYLYKGGMVS